MRVSILIAAYGRRALLERSLWFLERQTHPDIEIVLADDGGAEDLGQMPAAVGPAGMLMILTGEQPGWQPQRVYLCLRPPGSRPRGPNNVWRAAYAACTGGYIITAAPELLVRRDAVERMLAGHEAGRRDVPTLYSLSPEHTAFLARWWGVSVDYDLIGPDLSVLQDLPGFRAFEGSSRLANYRMGEFAHHMMFSGAYRDEWGRFGFLPETDDYGMDENWLREQEVAAGVPPRLAPIEVYHQWHERVLPFTMPVSERIRRIQEGG